MAKQSRSAPVMKTVLDAVAERLMVGDETLIRIPEICDATGVNYGSVYHHFGSREGVIDAAYDMVFASAAEQDVESLKSIIANAQHYDGYVASLQGLAGAFASGPQRQARRAMRIRIVAASMTRPELKASIGATQLRITTELSKLIELGQERGWIRHDLTSRSIAVFIMALLVGRSVDDISVEPIDDEEWSAAMRILLSELVQAPPS